MIPRRLFIKKPSFGALSYRLLLLILRDVNETQIALGCFTALSITKALSCRLVFLPCRMSESIQKLVIRKGLECLGDVLLEEH